MCVYICVYTHKHTHTERMNECENGYESEPLLGLITSL